MPLILNEDGKVLNSTDKSIDSLKRESYKHGNNQILKEEEKEEIASFIDSLEELPDEAGEGEISAENLDPDAAEIAMIFAEFKTNFIRQFGEEECQEAFLQFEDFFSGKGVDVNLDLSDLGTGGKGIPGVESSRQEIVTSEVEEEVDPTRQQLRAWLERKNKK